MSNHFASINGKLLAADQALLPAGDLAIQRGYGVFDFFKTLDGRPIFLDDHLDRFFHSAERMRLPMGRSREKLRSLLSELMRANDIAESGVRMTLTGGCAPDGYSIAEPNLVITQQPLRRSADLAARGARLITHPHRRQFPDVKTIDYLMAVWLQPELARRGADDVLYHLDGRISECPRANVFIVTADETVITPGDGILGGIVRKHVLALSRQRFATEEREVSLDEARQARECFITSTTKGVLPVVEIDGRPVGDGRAGPVTRALSDALARRIESQHG